VSKIARNLFAFARGRDKRSPASCDQDIIPFLVYEESITASTVEMLKCDADFVAHSTPFGEVFLRIDDGASEKSGDAGYKDFAPTALTGASEPNPVSREC
jgi:hypothetical protein